MNYVAVTEDYEIYIEAYEIYIEAYEIYIEAYEAYKKILIKKAWLNIFIEKYFNKK